MLGRFLEISVPVHDILASLAFYEQLGFVQATTGECWPYPYAVVTDGRLYLGLHQSGLGVATPTFVQPDLASHVAQLAQHGFVITDACLDGESFNEATLIDPEGQPVRLVEARTYSPPLLDATHESLLGYFAEYGRAVRDVAAVTTFWEALGFIALDGDSTVLPRVTLTSERLNLGFYRARAFRQPVLTFEDGNMKRRLDTLRHRGLVLSDDMPDALDSDSNAVLIAPEGTRLLLLAAAGADTQGGLQ